MPKKLTFFEKADIIENCKEKKRDTKMKENRIATVQDISCFGQCSLTVALPIISALGTETVILPTAVLSTHTAAGFEGFTFRDLTEDIGNIIGHWKKLNLKFDILYTGYLGSFEQVQLMSRFFDTFKTKDNLIVIDPVMGDHGRLYTGFTPEFAKEMAKLCQKADMIVPNLTEAAFLLGEPYIGDVYTKEDIEGILRRLCALGAKNAIVTGISFCEDKLGAMAYSAETDTFYSYFNERVPAAFHGTGDVFASACVGALANDLSLEKSLQLAVDFTLACIRETENCQKEHWYGVKFEQCIPYLIERMRELKEGGGR